MLIAMASVAVAHPISAQEVLPPVAGQRSDALHWLGVNSCAATACHGGRDRVRGGEYTTWINHDPHARAYSVLFDKRSLQMAKNLADPATGTIQPPHEDATCLSCHAPSGDGLTAGVYLGDGVGCESCHGAAEKWLAPHSKSGWDKRDVTRKQELGMLYTRDVLVRAWQCVGCHVGEPDRGVNHDLIAAGHPRLNFEFTTYLNLMPAHWDEKAERRNDPAFVVRSWAVGQAVSSAAAMRLLSHRAARESTWPEFAEYDCFACHHDLTNPSWRQNRGYNGRPGAPAWSDWYDPLPWAAGALHDAAGLGELRLLTPAGQRPDRRQTAEEAVAAAEQLDDWARKLNDRDLFTPVLTADLLTAMAADPPKRAGESWDASAQLYLALVALHRTTIDQQGGTMTPRDRAIESALAAMQNDLRFAHTVADAPYRYESPRDFQPKHFMDRLSELRQALAQP